MICEKVQHSLSKNDYGAVSDRCLRTGHSAGDDDVVCRRRIQAFQGCWDKRQRSEAMKNMVSVEDDFNDITHKRGQRTFGVLDAGWRCVDGSGILGVFRRRE